ncbi:MAG: hypothetical protein KIT81_14845, partial [Alphaproteobacteria bacterium]|nr:hypothetical protein [Alphaproteobacteria bacterium]
MSLANNAKDGLPAGPNRREVLQGTLAGAAAIGLPGLMGTAAAQGGDDLGRVRLFNPGRQTLRPAPVTFGFAAPRGALPRGQNLALVIGAGRHPVQIDFFNAWNDGTLRFGVISAIVPELPPGREIEARIARLPGPPPEGAPISASDIARYLEETGGAPNLEWLDRDSGAYRADATTALRGPAGWNPDGPSVSGRWLAGPVCTEWVCSIPLVNERRQAHPSLRAYFHCRAWQGGGRIVGARIDVVLDSTVGPFDTRVREAVGDLHIRRGSSPDWSRTGGDLSGAGLEAAAAGSSGNDLLLRARSAAFRPDHRFMTLDWDGVALHVLEVRSEREVLARPLGDEKCVVSGLNVRAAGPLSLNGSAVYRGIAYLHQSRRLRVAATAKQAMSGRRFHLKGRDGAGRPAEEILVSGADGSASGQQRFAEVHEATCDGPTGGTIEIGTARPALGRAGAARLWGVSIAAWTRWPIRLEYGLAGAEPMLDPGVLVTSGLLPSYGMDMVSKGHPAWVERMVRSIAGQTDSSGRIIPGSRDPDYSHGRCLNVIMGGAQPGGRPDLAVVPGQQAAWVFAPTNRAMYRAMLACGHAMHQWPCHWRERETGLGVDPGRRRSFTTHFNASENDKPPHWRRSTNTIARIATDPEHWI